MNLSLTDRGYRSLLQDFAQQYPSELASLLEELQDTEILGAIETLSGSQKAKLFSHLSIFSASRALRKMDLSEFSELARSLDPVRLAVILSRYRQRTVEEKLAVLPKERAKELAELMKYPQNTAGSMMDTRVIAFRENELAGSVIEKLRKLKDRRLFEVCIIDEQSHLKGLIPLHELLSAEEQVKVGTLVKSTRSIEAMMSKQQVVEILETDKVLNLPVVNHTGELLGVIRHEALVKVVEQDASSDLQAMVGAGREEQALSPVLFSVQKRLPWLAINLSTTFIAAAVVSFFESTIARVTALAVLLPVVAGQSGNTGAQALAVTMRALSLREVRVGQWARILFKESAVGLLNGLILGILCALGVYLWSQSMVLGLVIGFAMLVSMMIAALSGAAVPVLLTVFRLDPAQSSSIILTTVTDIVGFLSFLGLASLLVDRLI